LADVIAVIPAHNEEAGIAATIKSLQRQSFPLRHIIVAADNCTDNTEAIAAALGATVFSTAGNVHRKAGALNQALRWFMPGWDDETLVLVMDADSALIPQWVELAIPWVMRHGTVSGAYETCDARGLLPLLQRVEYAHERQRIAKRSGRVSVLSGAASMFRVDVLRTIADSRGSVLPGHRGDFYNPQSLTEDFEITLAAQRLGYEAVSPEDLRVVTDVMRTARELAGQRLRWQRGYLETLREYPLRQTRSAWAIQTWIYASSLLPIVMVALIALSWDLYGPSYQPMWLLLVPVFAGIDAYAARRSGVRGQLLAGAVVPLYIYNIFRYGVYWTALYRSLRGGQKVWT
jgi:poly-beta-1,6-N-acetyl-D-glucosamine synthase